MGKIRTPNQHLILFKCIHSRCRLNLHSCWCCRSDACPLSIYQRHTRTYHSSRNQGNGSIQTFRVSISFSPLTKKVPPKHKLFLICLYNTKDSRRWRCDRHVSPSTVTTKTYKNAGGGTFFRWSILRDPAAKHELLQVILGNPLESNGCSSGFWSKLCRLNKTSKSSETHHF